MRMRERRLNWRVKGGLFSKDIVKEMRIIARFQLRDKGRRQFFIVQLIPVDFGEPGVLLNKFSFFYSKV